jgi:hypothetical protein
MKEDDGQNMINNKDPIPRRGIFPKAEIPVVSQQEPGTHTPGEKNPKPNRQPSGRGLFI